MNSLSLFLSLRFIILGCDGLFKVFSAEEAVKYILNILQVYIMLTMCVYGKKSSQDVCLLWCVTLFCGYFQNGSVEREMDEEGEM